MLTRLVPMGLLLALASGCLSGPMEDDSDPVDLPSVLPMDHAEFTDCIGQSASLSWLQGTNPSRPPSGWEQELEGTSSTFVWMMECGRVRVGPFERPLAWALEGFNNVDPPAACTGDGRATVDGLHWIGTSDAEISTWLTNQTGIQFDVIEVDLRPDVLPAMGGFALRNADGVLLEGSVADPGMRGVQPFGSFSLFQETPGGLVSINVTLGMGGTSGVAPEYTGTASEPLLAGQARQPLVGSYSAFVNGPSSWEYRRYASLDCT